MSDLLNEQQMRAMLQARCDLLGSQREFARQNGISASVVSQVLNAGRGISPEILAALGFTKVTRFAKVRTKDQSIWIKGGQEAVKQE